MNATIKPSFWTDERLEDAPFDIKLAVLWLVTNPARDLCGFTRATPKRFTFETGLPASSLDGASKAMPSSIVKLPGGVYFVVNFLRHQFGKGGHLSPKNKVLVAAVRHAMGLPSPMLEAFVKAYPELIETTPVSIPHPSPIHGGCHGVRVREGERAESKGVKGEASDLDLPGVVAMYPKRERQAEAIEALAIHVRKGADLDAVREGVRGIAAVIAQLPGKHLNAYVPSAASFFRNRRWEDDPRTWLRNAGKHANGAPQGTLDLGGRRAASETIIG